MILVIDGTTEYYIDGTMLDTVTKTNSLTSYPTIEGTSFSDHYYREPDSIGFQINSSGVSKSLVYSKSENSFGATVQKFYKPDEISDLVKSWFKNATRVTVVAGNDVHTARFDNMVLKSYSWTDNDMDSFRPSLSFEEARVQTLRTAKINNPDAYYQAAYGDTISLGGAVAVESSFNFGSTLIATGIGAAIGAKFGPWGALAGGAIGFLGSLLNEVF